jgi:transposase
MITVDQYRYIRTAHRVYGKKIREIARDTGHSKNTVKRALKEEYCGYTTREKQPYPVLGPYVAIIDRWLEGDKDKPKKQRHTAKRIYDRLCHEHSFMGSDRAVRRYVRDAKMRLGLGVGEVFIPLDPELGLEAEVDWGMCYAVLAGTYTKLKMFCIRSKGSGKFFLQCFPCERQQALFEGHIRAFHFFGGVFPTLIYDNLSTVVDKVLRGKGRKLHESFVKFEGYYNFRPRFCNPGQGHEKGGVEGLVGYARRNYLVPIPKAENLEELNQRLLEQCLAYGDHRMAGKEKTVNEFYEEEKEHLLPLPDVPFSNIETYSGKVDKYATVMIDKNHYSVPIRYAGIRARIVAYVDHVDIFYGSRKIATHGRLYGNNKWQLDPFHYLELILRRPQAFESARPIKQWRKEWPECLEKLLRHFCQKQGQTKGTKDFIRVLLFFKEHDEREVISAVGEAVSANVSSSDSVEQLLINRGVSQNDSFAPLRNWETIPSPDVSVYDRIGGAL